jgi:hypothetical protein
MNGLYVENGTVFIDWKLPDSVLRSYMDLSLIFDSAISEPLPFQYSAKQKMV